MPSIYPCPECGEYHYYKSHSRNLYERIRKKLLKQQLYRCHRCGYRGWEKILNDQNFTSENYIVYFIVAVAAFFFGLLFKALIF